MFYLIHPKSKYNSSSKNTIRHKSSKKKKNSYFKNVFKLNLFIYFLVQCIKI